MTHFKSTFIFPEGKYPFKSRCISASSQRRGADYQSSKWVACGILACNGKTPDRVASSAMRPYRTITSRCLLQSCRLTDAQTGFFSAGSDGEPAGRAGSSGATGAQGNPGSHFTHADSQMRPHTRMHARIHSCTFPTSAVHRPTTQHACSSLFFPHCLF